MPARFAITKQTSTGESIVVDICQWNPVTGEMCHEIDEMKEMADELLKIADIRFIEMNRRVIEAANLREYCTPQEWVKMCSVFDIIEGRQSADMVAQRWQAAIEETQALEQGRLEAALQNGMD